MGKKFLLQSASLLLLSASSLCWAQTSTGSRSESPEDFRIEITGSAWIVNSGGHFIDNGTPVDFVSDLNLSQQRPTFYGLFVFKPARKHRIVVEGTPFNESGSNTVQRTIVYRGRSFNISDNIQSSANLNYLFVGYQYDLLSSPRGHLGVSVGGAYVSAAGTIIASQSSTPATGTQTVGLPLAGVEFRLFPIPHHRLFEIDGGARGMAFGNYGYFSEFGGNAGLGFGPVTFQAGYRDVSFDLHNDRMNATDVTARLKGPIVSLLFRW